MKRRLLNFFRELYKDEIELKNNLNSQTQIAIGVTTVLTGVVFSLFINLLPVPLATKINLFYFIHLLFYILFSLSIIFLMIIIYHIYKALVSYKYVYMPRFSEIKTYAEKLMKYNEGNIEKTEEDFEEDFLLKFYIDADKNMESNFWKAEHNTIAMKWLFRLLIVIVFMMVPFSLINLSKKEIVNVKIINQEGGGESMSEQDKPSEKKENPKQAAPESSKKEETQKPKAPEGRIITGAKDNKKPEPPQARIFKEGEEGKGLEE